MIIPADPDRDVFGIFDLISRDWSHVILLTSTTTCALALTEHKRAKRTKSRNFGFSKILFACIAAVP